MVEQTFVRSSRNGSALSSGNVTGKLASSVVTAMVMALVAAVTTELMLLVTVRTLSSTIPPETHATASSSLSFAPHSR